MHLDTRVAAIVIAAQSFLMGGLLLAIASGRPGTAPRSLALRGLAMLSQGAGFVLVGQSGVIDSHWLGPATGALILLGHGLTLVGLRMLLGAREYNWTIAGVLTCSWLAMSWTAWMEPDGIITSTLRPIYSTGYALAACWPVVPRLRRPHSIGARIWVGTAVFVAATQIWGLLSKSGSVSLAAASTSMIMWLVALMPTLTGVAFLMMYNEAVQADLHDLARIDPLTGVNNRRALMEQLERAMARAEPTRQIAVLLIDVDRFKQVNDRFGHAAGDRLLTDIARHLGRTLRRRDVLGRLGGEEFLVIASVQNIEEALDLGERLRAVVETSVISVDGEALRTTVSIGLTVDAERRQTVPGILDHADRALYKAKHAGRNRLAVWP